MNRRIVVALFAALLLAPAIAQDAGKSSAKGETQKVKVSAEARTRATAERITRVLKLTKPQQSKLAELLQAQDKRAAAFRKLATDLFQAARAKDTERVAKLRAQLKQLQSAEPSSADRLYKQLEPILTAAQKARLPLLRRRTSSSSNRSVSRRDPLDKATIAQLRSELKLTDSQAKQFDRIAQPHSKGDIFGLVEPLLDAKQKEILSRFRARHVAMRTRAAGIRGILRAAERLDLDVKQQQKIRRLKRTTRKRLALLHSNSDALAADFEAKLTKEISALLRPAQIERFQRLASGNRKVSEAKRGPNSKPAKKP